MANMVHLALENPFFQDHPRQLCLRLPLLGTDGLHVNVRGHLYAGIAQKPTEAPMSSPPRGPVKASSSIIVRGR